MADGNPQENNDRNKPGQNGSGKPPVRFDQLGGLGQFLVNFLMLLTQLVDPDKKSNGNMVNLISKAFGFESPDEYRNLRNDIRKRGREAARDDHDYSRLNARAAAKAVSKGASMISDQAPQDPTERQQRVTSVLADASKTAGVSSKFLVGLWGFESSFGKGLKSNTGCQGDFQFTRSTMAEVIGNKGLTIASKLREQASTEKDEKVKTSLNNQADVVSMLHDGLSRNGKAVSKDQIDKFLHDPSNKKLVDALRNSPETSTYAAAFYSRTIADDLRVDPTNEKSFGLMYAGYNVGTGNAQKMKNGQVATGWEVDANKGVAGKGTARAQLASYQDAIESRAESRQGQAHLKTALAEQEEIKVGGKGSIKTDVVMDGPFKKAVNAKIAPTADETFITLNKPIGPVAQKPLAVLPTPSMS